MFSEGKPTNNRGSLCGRGKQSRAKGRGMECRSTLHVAGSGVCIPGGKVLSLSQIWREGGCAGERSLAPLVSP